MEGLLECIRETTHGYHPLVQSGEWRVAVLNWHEDLLPHSIYQFQKHDETDEIFVLLQGQCVLYVLDEADGGVVHGVALQPQSVYRVNKGVYHSHTLSEDAMVLIVENDNTSLDNSPFVQLTGAQKNRVVEIARQEMKTADGETRKE